MNLKKQMLISTFVILAIVGCGKKEATQNEDQDEIQIEQQSADTTNNNSQSNPHEAQPVVESSENVNENATNQPASQVKPEEIKSSQTLQHVDRLIGKEISMEDRILVFSKENNQYKITYKGESENGMQVDTKNLTFNEKNDSLTDGTYTFKLNQFLFTVD